MRKILSIFSFTLFTLILLVEPAFAYSRYILKDNMLYLVSSSGEVLSKGSGSDDEDEDENESESDEDIEDEKDDERDGRDERKDDRNKEKSSSGSRNSGSGSLAPVRRLIKIEVEDEGDEIDDEVEDEIEDELDNEIETGDDTVSGKALLRIKQRTEAGRIDFRIRQDGRVEMKVKSKDGSLAPLLEEVLESTATKDILSILPGKLSDDAKVEIKVAQNKFEIKSKISTAVSKFPLSVDTENNILIVQTPSGNINLRVLPDEAIANLVRNKKIETVISSELEENKQSTGSADRLVYKVKGLETRKLFGVIPVVSEVEAEIGAESGAIVGEVLPWYLKTFGFLFTK